MHTRSNLHILYTILIIMIAQAKCSEFLCYICNDCAEITENTPKQVCDETFFNTDSTSPSTVTTDSTEINPTTIETTDSTVSQSTESTSLSPPSPPTVGPVETITSLPTPANPGTVQPVESVLLNNETTTDETITETTDPSTTSHITDETLPTTILQPVKLTVQTAEIHMRKSRSIVNAEYTYHCYSVQQKINGTITTSRGCSRVGPSEGVCNQLEEANNKTKYSSCYPCSNLLCNSSDAVGVPMITIMSGLFVALILKSSA